MKLPRTTAIQSTTFKQIHSIGGYSGLSEFQNDSQGILSMASAADKYHKAWTDANAMKSNTCAEMEAKLDAMQKAIDDRVAEDKKVADTTTAKEKASHTTPLATWRDIKAREEKNYNSTCPSIPKNCCHNGVVGTCSPYGVKCHKNHGAITFTPGSGGAPVNNLSCNAITQVTTGGKCFSNTVMAAGQQ